MLYCCNKCFLQVKSKTLIIHKNAVVLCYLKTTISPAHLSLIIITSINTNDNKNTTTTTTTDDNTFVWVPFKALNVTLQSRV